jgi:hypothetical protein
VEKRELASKHAELSDEELDRRVRELDALLSHPER